MTSEEVQIDLRERRRSQTCREISDAALDLFERQGIAATTVEDIARASGVSARTFFRLCGTKEQAVLDDTEIDGAMQSAVERIDVARPLRAQLVGFWRHEMRTIEEDLDGHRRHLRVRRLIADEPVLLAAALRQEHERDERFVRSLVEATGKDELPIRALVEWLSTLIRLSIEEWLRVVDAGGTERLESIYGRALAALQGSDRV